LSSSSQVISLRKSIYSRTTMLSLFGDNNDDDDYDAVSSSKLPYSTTTSNSASSSSPVAAAAAVLSLESRSSSPFRAPRSSFDDSLPSTLMIDSKGKVTDGTLEWSKLGLLTDLVDAVVGDVDDRLGLGLIDGPTPVQRMAIPEILMACKDRMAFVEDPKNDKMDGFPPVRSIAFAAATGSGKTLAYLLPIVQSLRAQELLALGELTGDRRMEALSILRRPRRPRALVLAPTRELARQILSKASCRSTR